MIKWGPIAFLFYTSGVCKSFLLKRTFSYWQTLYKKEETSQTSKLQVWCPASDLRHCLQQVSTDIMESKESRHPANHLLPHSWTEIMNSGEKNTHGPAAWRWKLVWGKAGLKQQVQHWSRTTRVDKQRQSTDGLGCSKRMTIWVFDCGCGERRM